MEYEVYITGNNFVVNKENKLEKVEFFGIREVDTGRPLLFPNNDMIMFLDRESAEKVCDLINNKAV